MHAVCAWRMYGMAHVAYAWRMCGMAHHSVDAEEEVDDAQLLQKGAHVGGVHLLEPVLELEEDREPATVCGRGCSRMSSLGPTQGARAALRHPRSRSFALEPGGRPCASARAPAAVGGRLCGCRRVSSMAMLRCIVKTLRLSLPKVPVMCSRAALMCARCGTWARRAAGWRHGGADHLLDVRARTHTHAQRISLSLYPFVCVRVCTMYSVYAYTHASWICWRSCSMKGSRPTLVRAEHSQYVTLFTWSGFGVGDHSKVRCSHGARAGYIQ